MLDIGIIGLDTSHAEAFAPLIDEAEDMTVSAVWDDNSVREPSYTETFASKYDARYFHEPGEMVSHVDAAMVLTVDWGTHRPLATPFLKAGVPTLIDKPLAGRYEDIEAIAAATEHAPLFGGSAVPFHPEIMSLMREETGRSLFGAGYNDYFYYRVHMVDAIRMLADADWTEVRVVDSPGTRTEIRFSNGTHGTIRFDGTPTNASFGLLDVGTETRAVRIEGNETSFAEMYAPFLAAFKSVATGDRDDTRRLLDSATLLLGIEAAIESGRTITPDSDLLREVYRDGDSFLAEYEPYY